MKSGYKTRDELLEEFLKIINSIETSSSSSSSSSASSASSSSSSNNNNNNDDNDNDNNNDDSIIDVTNQSYKINSNIDLIKYRSSVPKWGPNYVYSYSEINSASVEQINFYSFFKNSFLDGKYYDLQDNTNYAFILLFDFLIEFDNDKQIPKLESQITILGKCYPKTKSFGVTFLIQKMMDSEDTVGATRQIIEQRRYENEIIVNNNRTPEYWKLGIKYKSKLNLNKEQVAILNRVTIPNNNFCNIEYCMIEVLKLYLSVIKELEAKYKKEKTTLEAQLLVVSDLIARKQYNFRNGSKNYVFCIETSTNEFHGNIYRYCENAVRAYYGHSRNLDIDFYYANQAAKTEFETKVIYKLLKILPTFVSRIALPDPATELSLYTNNKSRWKIKFEQLTTNYNHKPAAFVDSIISIANLNIHRNSIIATIFFEASKFMAVHDKESVLILYLHHLCYDSKHLSPTNFKQKKLPKSIKEILFITKEQSQVFETIVSELIKDKNLNNALNKVAKFYEIKRKKIQLDSASIKAVQQQHSGTVELLNEYLKDDFEQENTSIKPQNIDKQDIKIKTDKKSDKKNKVISEEIKEPKHAAFVSDLSFTPLHICALELFGKCNFIVSQSEFEAFAKSKGVFKNQLIESINETCYEFLDDVLIEEEDDYYTINTNYFQIISAK